jgi:hypothetical protein
MYTVTHRLTSSDSTVLEAQQQQPVQQPQQLLTFALGFPSLQPQSRPQLISLLSPAAPDKFVTPAKQSLFLSYDCPSLDLTLPS